MMNRENQSKYNIAYLVFLAFSITLALFISLIVYGLFYIQSVNEDMRLIVEEHNTKEYLVTNMHNNARERVMSLFQMVLSDDPFERDDLYMSLNSNGAEFIRARISFLEMSLNDEEAEILEQQGKLTSIAVPLQEQIIDFLSKDKVESARSLLIEEGLEAQNHVLNKLSELASLQKQKTAAILDESNRQYEQVTRLTLWLGISASILGFIIAILTSRKVHKDQQALNQLNAELEQRVNERTLELSLSNTELEETVATLKSAKNQLIESEKLASLGSMVAGVAHELNTPLGNSVTATSALAHNQENFQALCDENKIKRSDLQVFLDEIKLGLDLIMRNLMRSSDLVKSFKQVAVDQTSQKQRNFILDQVINEDLLTLRPLLKKTPHEIQLDLEKDIQVNSFPGPLGQVIINVIMNAINHAFDHKAHGIISIECKKTGNDTAAIIISDNGKGIPDNEVKKVFDPFYTTKLGQGGSGLGMHIAYNIVNGLLGGDISVSSKTGEGTTVSLSLPLIAPDKS